MSTQVNPLPPSCARTRDAYGLQLVDATPPGPEAEAHVKICPACALVVGRMKETWDDAGDALASLGKSQNLDAILERVIARKGHSAEGAWGSGGEAPGNQIIAPAVIVPFHRRSIRRANAVGFSVGLALAASLVAFAFLVPPLFEEPATELVRAPGVPKVVLAAAKGEVSHVPADGSVVSSPKAGDVLAPGLFAATGGAALSIEGQGLLAVRGDAHVWIGGAEKAPELTIARGEIFVDLPKGTIQTFIVRTPNGAVHVTGTQFKVDVRNVTKVDVTRGSVKLVGPDGERAVTAGETATLGSLDMSAVPLVVDPADDPFSWVRDLAPDRVPPAVIAMNAPKKSAMPAGTPDELETLSVAGLPRIVVENAMEKREASMRYCYEQALVGDSELRVRAAIRFTVDEAGLPKDLRIDGVQNEKLRACLMESARAARFPPTAPGTEVRISYPVKLEPALEE